MSADEDVFEASEVREILDRFEEQNWNRHTDNAHESVENYVERVVEDGQFMPGSRVYANLNLTLRERLTGEREQDMTAFLVMGLMFGSALERDVPMGSALEDAWCDGAFVLPESGRGKQ